MNLIEEMKAGFSALKADLTAGLASRAALETQVSTLTAELATARGSLATAEARVAELAKIDTAKLTTDLATAQTALTAAQAEIVSLKAIIADPKGHIEMLASAKAAEICAAQGAKPLPAAGAVNPAAVPSPGAGLKGRAKVAACIKAQLDQDFPQRN